MPRGQKSFVTLFSIWVLVTLGLVVANIVWGKQFGDPNVIWRTILLAVFTAGLSIPIGAVVAWAAAGRGTINRILFVALIGLLVVPLFSHVSAWDSAIGKLGWLSATIGNVLTPMVSGWSAAVWAHTVAVVPFVAVIILVGYWQSNRSYEEQALLDSSAWVVFWNVSFRRMIPLLILSLLWIFVSCSREIAATDIYRIGTLAEQIYLGYSMGQVDNVRGNWTTDQLFDAQSLTLTLTLMIVGHLILSALLLFTATTDEEFLSGQWRPSPDAGSRSTSSGHFARSTAAMVALVVFVLLPAANLVYRASFFVENVNGTPTPGRSLTQVGNVLKRVFTDYVDEFTWSILIAGSAATIIVMISTCLAWKARSSRLWRIVFVVSLAVSCAIPGPLLGTWLIQCFAVSDAPWLVWLYDRTITAPVIANVIYCWPLAAMIVWFCFRHVAKDALENAMLEGAGGISRLLHFGIKSNPLLLPGCWLIALAICFGELSASQMVLPPGIDSVPRLTLGLLHAGVDEMTAALTIVTISGIVGISLVGWGLTRLNRGAQSPK